MRQHDPEFFKSYVERCVFLSPSMIAADSPFARDQLAARFDTVAQRCGVARVALGVLQFVNAADFAREA